MIVDREDKPALDSAQGSGEALVVLPAEGEPRAVSGQPKVRRVAIEKGVRPVVTPQDVAEVQALEDNVPQPAVDGPDVRLERLGVDADGAGRPVAEGPPSGFAPNVCLMR